MHKKLFYTTLIACHSERSVESDAEGRDKKVESMLHPRIPHLRL